MQFNWLGTIFYISYLVFEYPQNLALQKFPVGKWIRLASESPVHPCRTLLTENSSLSRIAFPRKPAQISIPCGGYTPLVKSLIDLPLPIQHQHLHMGRRTHGPRGLQILWRALCRALHLGRMRRRYHAWFHDRHLHVLYA
jgi:hypothetical protein